MRLGSTAAERWPKSNKTAALKPLFYFLKPPVFRLKTGGFGIYLSQAIYTAKSWLFQYCHSFSWAWQSAFWAAMVAKVSPSCTSTELRRLISSGLSLQAMVFANAVTAAVRLQAFISESPLQFRICIPGVNGHGKHRWYCWISTDLLTMLVPWKNGCFCEKTTVFWTFKRILACCPGTAWSTLLWFRFFEKKLEWKIQPGGKTEENYHIFMSLPWSHINCWVWGCGRILRSPISLLQRHKFFAPTFVWGIFVCHGQGNGAEWKQPFSAEQKLSNAVCCFPSDNTKLQRLPILHGEERSLWQLFLRSKNPGIGWAGRGENFAALDRRLQLRCGFPTM